MFENEPPSRWRAVLVLLLVLAAVVGMLYAFADMVSHIVEGEMKKYFYRRLDGTVISLEAEQLFWSGAACVFVKSGSTTAVIALLPGELICEEHATGVNVPQFNVPEGAKPS